MATVVLCVGVLQSIPEVDVQEVEQFQTALLLCLLGLPPATAGGAGHGGAAEAKGEDEGGGAMSTACRVLCASNAVLECVAERPNAHHSAR